MQTKGEYTPGPWHTHLHGRPELDNEEWLVLADDENVNEGDSLICSVNTLSGDDARLIAAAPELLEACERAAKTFRGYAAIHAAKNTDEGDAKRAVNEVLAEAMEAAIAKAKGTPHA